MLWSLSAITATKEEHGMDSGLNAQAVCSNARFFSLVRASLRDTQVRRELLFQNSIWRVFPFIVLFIYIYIKEPFGVIISTPSNSENFQVLLQSYNNNLFFEGKNIFFFLNLKKNIVIIAGVWNAAGGTRFQKSLSSETKNVYFERGVWVFLWNGMAKKHCN